MSPVESMTFTYEIAEESEYLQLTTQQGSDGNPFLSVLADE